MVLPVTADGFDFTFRWNNNWIFLFWFTLAAAMKV